MPFRFRKLQRTINLFPTSQKSFAHAKNKFGANQNETQRDDRNVHTLPASLPRRSASCSQDAVTWVTDYLPAVVPFCLNLPAVYSYKDSHHSLITTCQDEKSIQPALTTVVKKVSLTGDDICVRQKRCFSEPDLLSVCERIPVNFISEPSPLPDCTVNRFSGLSNKEDINSTTQFSCSSNSNTPFDSSNILLFSSTGGRRSDKSSNKGKGPTPEQLGDAIEPCKELVQQLMDGHTSHAILHPDIVLENNLHGTNRVSNGLTAYKMEILRLWMMINVSTTKASLDIMNVTSVHQTGVLRIHWRMSGYSLLTRFKLMANQADENDIQCIEAFSYFHIGNDGLVHKIRIDRSLPEDGEEPVKLKEKLKNMLNPKPSPAMCT